MAQSLAGKYKLLTHLFVHAQMRMKPGDEVDMTHEDAVKYAALGVIKLAEDPQGVIASAVQSNDVAKMRDALAKGGEAFRRLEAELSEREDECEELRAQLAEAERKVGEVGDLAERAKAALTELEGVKAEVAELRAKLGQADGGSTPAETGVTAGEQTTSTQPDDAAASTAKPAGKKGR